MGLTKVTAVEAAGTGITANSICPGWLRTPLVDKQIEAAAISLGVSHREAAANLVGEKQPLQEFATPEQIGGVAKFLCSDDASMITGTSVPVDGGWTAV